ncbi:ABC-F type ribosomal protection protein [Paenibacillus sp. GSMTC-2017]|uniref:ribosomal protection-like ABC-F family protein n=1 Tax=Paenibacillus sp. GSMTC-2017 TaxID=2794350 RepID=UPI0018D8017C|nr:ABC-F type ribosomal protection protein [Paenibacillus sp. GSMTC-2017]MBH5319065.1 ABC-F type ribosomal protection protein [Paenibacillus sp. GSMTC-2017]
MMIMKVTNLSKEWDGETLFDHLSFEVNEGERIALFGRNGVGKTTLLHCLTGRVAYDGGTVQQLLPLADWGWMDQQTEHDSTLSLFEFVLSGSSQLFVLKCKLNTLLVQMEAGEVSDELINEYSERFDQYTDLNGYGWERKAEVCLRQLQLPTELWGHPFEQLSGGQKTKAQLASLLLKEPKLLLLDEPTNHLDSDALRWLEDWVRTYSGTIIYVSHDRTFIDHTATAIIELDRNGAKRYTGGYTDYRKQKELELRTAEALYKKQEQEREKLLESIRMYSQWFQQAHKAAGQNDFLRSKSKKNVSRQHAKESALQRLNDDRVKKPREADELHMRIEGETFEASTLLRMEHVYFSYDPQSSPILDRVNLTVGRGQCIAVIGPNGVGKSTLMKVAIGQLEPTNGTVIRHPGVRIGYFEQELDRLDEETTLLDSLLELPGMTQSHARTVLACFLFRKEEVFKRIGNLSMGEKCRVAFLRLFFGKCNLLVLDEPTNYLDVATRERVEEALEHYPGAILLVTHDRYLTRKLATSLMVMGRESAPVVFPGTYDEYESMERTRPTSIETQHLNNEKELLRLKLAQLMSTEDVQAVDGQQLLEQIRSIRQQLEVLEST